VTYIIGNLVEQSRGRGDMLGNALSARSSLILSNFTCGHKISLSTGSRLAGIPSPSSDVRIELRLLCDVSIISYGHRAPDCSNRVAVVGVPCARLGMDWSACLLIIAKFSPG